MTLFSDYFHTALPQSYLDAFYYTNVCARIVSRSMSYYCSWRTTRTTMRMWQPKNFYGSALPVGKHTVTCNIACTTPGYLTAHDNRCDRSSKRYRCSCTNGRSTAGRMNLSKRSPPEITACQTQELEASVLAVCRARLASVNRTVLTRAIIQLARARSSLFLANI